MSTKPLMVGWREWASLPSLNIPLIKVKIDTGARTSSLHVYDLRVVVIEGKEFAEFIIHPIQSNDRICRKTMVEIIGRRVVKSSNGHKEIRLVIRSKIQIGGYIWDIDITLASRDIMRHRMLLGRSAMKKLIVNPSRSYFQGVVSDREALIRYEPVILE